jgi:hypothetical protein
MNRDYLGGMVGTFTPIAAVAASTLEQIEVWLRIGGLIVGLIVGLISLYHQLKKFSE